MNPDCRRSRSRACFSREKSSGLCAEPGAEHEAEQCLEEEHRFEVAAQEIAEAPAAEMGMMTIMQVPTVSSSGTPKMTMSASWMNAAAPMPNAAERKPTRTPVMLLQR